MGKTETIHDWGSSDCGCLSVGVGVDGGNSADFCDGAGDGWSLDLVDLGGSSLRRVAGEVMHDRPGCAYHLCRGFCHQCRLVLYSHRTGRYHG